MTKRSYNLMKALFVTIAVICSISVSESRAAPGSTAIGTSAMPGAQAEGWQYERLRLRPRLDILEHYSDNIFLAPDTKKDEFFTEIDPQLAVDFAFAPKNYITAEYRGNYYKYDTYDNFDESEYFAQLSWNLETSKGSFATAGASTTSSSVQPYSETDKYKEYDRNRYFIEGLLAIGQVTQVGAGFEEVKRTFDEETFEIDDYTRQQADFEIVYGRSVIFPLLLQYRYVNQDNQDLDGINRDWVAHSIFTGAYWRGEGKMSGAFRVGYTAADFKDDGIEDISGLGADIDMIYNFSDITRFRLTGQRSVEPVTTSQRERGNYYVLTGAGLRIIHHRWDRITTELGYRYNYKDFKITQDQNRVDEEQIADVILRYDLRRWIGFSLGYQFTDYDSDDDRLDYKENAGSIGLHLSI